MLRVLRKQLDHKTHYVGRFGAIYFITICCEQRGTTQLCCETTSKTLFETARIYHEHGRWNLKLMLLMPDHLNALIGVDGQDSLSQFIRDYKRVTARMAGVRWQRNFFDHRLRHDESLAEKFAYICQNLVRAGLVQNEPIGLTILFRIRNSAGKRRLNGILVAAIETRSLPSSLAAAHRGFTFYLADSSARLTSIAKAVRVSGASREAATQTGRPKAE
jgi:putative transposase